MFNLNKILEKRKFPKNEVEGIRVGTRLDLDVDDVIEFFNWWVQRVEFLIQLDYKTHNRFTTLSDEMMYSRGVTYEEFHDLFNPKILPEEFGGYRIFQILEIKSEKQRAHFQSKLSLDKNSYLKIILKYVNPELIKWYREKTLPPILSIKRMRAHTYVMAPTQGGKTELLRHMFYELQSKYNNYSLVVVDPHGGLSDNIRRSHLQKNNERFIYIDPSLGNEETFPAFNVFEIKSKSLFMIDKAVNHIATAIQEMIPGDAEMSFHSKGVLKRCVEFLLSRKHSTLLDLKNLTALKSDILKEAEAYDEYFSKVFQHDEAQSRKAVFRRLENILISKIAQTFLTRKSTFDFEGAINSGKVILFDLSSPDDDAKEAIGKFLIASIRCYAGRRKLKKEKPIPTFVFVDECQKFVSGSYKKMLDELSKFGLHLILSNQRYEELGSQANSVVANTNIKIVRGKNKSEINKVIDVPPNFTFERSKDGNESAKRMNLTDYEFILQIQNEKTIKFKSPNYLIANSKFELTEEEFEELKQYQLKKYYTPVEWKKKEKLSFNSELTPVEDDAGTPPFELYIKVSDE